MNDVTKKKATVYYRRDKVNVTRINKVFKVEYLVQLEDSIKRCHEIFTLASQFLKLYIIDEFEKSITDSKCDKLKTFESFSKRFTLEHSFFSNALTVVTSELGNKTGRPFKSDSDVANMYESYDRFRLQHIFPESKPDGKNLSHVFSYMATQLRTAYLNNIKLHFPKYVKRKLRLRMKKVMVTEANVEAWTSLPFATRKSYEKIINQVIRRLYDDEEDSNNLEEKWQQILQETRKESNISKDWLLDLYNHPHKFLPIMIDINRWLEESSYKLYSPLPFRNEFITKSIMIDTHALVDIFVNQDNLPMLKEYLATKGWQLPPKFNKGDFYTNKVDKLDHVYLEKGISVKNQFRQDVWKFFTQNRIHKGFMGLVFNNMVTTNGYQCSSHYVDKETYARERYTPGIYVKRDVKEEFEYVHKLAPDVRTNLLTDDRYKIASVDPGKGKPVTISTGFNKENKDEFISLDYSSGERRFDMCGFRNEKERRNLLDTMYDHQSTYRDLLETLKSSGKSCIKNTFQEYIFQRSEVVDALSRLFARTAYRRMQYRSFLGNRSSVDKLINKIKTTIPVKEGQDLILMWGNWGRNPNLKNQPPSPGIGLRRKLHKRFHSYTVDERGTSSICPKCDSEMEYPLKREEIQEDEISGKKERVEESIHHVLRCKNAKCGTWWDRDVAGSCNIGRQAKFSLENGTLNPVFTKATKPKKTSRKKRTSGGIKGSCISD